MGQKIEEEHALKKQQYFWNHVSCPFHKHASLVVLTVWLVGFPSGEKIRDKDDDDALI